MALKVDSSNQDGINDINITPFVDIVLVLLIIFMISTPALVYKGMRVSLPTLKNSEDISHVTLNFLLDKEGKLFLDSRPISFEQLAVVFQQLSATRTHSDAIISADAAVPHGRVMEVADFLRGNGLKEVGFAGAGGSSKKAGDSPAE